MNTWKVLLTDGLAECGRAILSDSAEIINRTGISAEDLLEIVGECDAMIVRGRTKVTSAVFAAASRLKVVGRAGVGVDNIDLDTARERNITVVNSPTATSLAVAELTVGLMLAQARGIAKADAGMKSGEWLKKKLKGVELYDKTLGVIGFGRIGSNVAQRAAAFGMKVLGYDPLIPGDEIIKRGGEPVSLDKLYEKSDWITLHIPLTDDTRGMLNTKAFAKMKSGVRIVCAARGGVIDEDALLAALESGQVAGAGLDVFATEPPGENDLVNHPNVVTTPHIGAQTVEAQKRTAVDISNEVLAALRGETLRWKVA